MPEFSKNYKEINVYDCSKFSSLIDDSVYIANMYNPAETVNVVQNGGPRGVAGSVGFFNNGQTEIMHKEDDVDDPTSKEKYLKIYEKLEKYCNMKRQTHWMCSRHYTYMDRSFSIPAILLSSLSGIASFLASTEHFENINSYLTISVGVMASLTTLSQSFSNAFEYSTKAEAHQNATEAFDQIITKIRFERINPKKLNSGKDFISEIKKQIVETKQRCKYIVPDWIEEDYNDKKFNNLKNNLLKEVYKDLMEMKTHKYLSAMKTKEYDELDLTRIDDELGFKDLNEKGCCEN